AASQYNHNHTHPEVLRIHVQLVTVQLTQLSKGALEVVEMFQAVTEGLEHLLAVGLHLGIAHDGIGIGQVPKGLEEPLSPGVDNQQPEGSRLLSRQMHTIVSVCAVAMNTFGSEASVGGRWPCSSFYAPPASCPPCLEAEQPKA
uniref:Uncharacterized protein n=1 Tax=Sus scrofa TaxID=9823 RepID=A0A8D1DZV1_PIG